MDPIIRLEVKVFSDVVYDEGLPDIASQDIQIFYIDSALGLATISVQSVLDQHPLAIYLIEDPVCVLFQTCREHNNFEDLAHLLQELDSEGSGLESTSALIKMD
jgi:hypothetical protein